MIRVTLSDPERRTVAALRHDRTLQPTERDRGERVLLSAAGWSPPAIAAHLGYWPATVRTLLKRYHVQGPAALRRQRPGPPPNAARRQQVTTALERLLAPPRTWTTPQLAHALPEPGITLSARQVRRYLRGRGARWRRTARSLRHKQDPDRVEQAQRVLTMLAERTARGVLQRAWLDECGFSPSLPVTWSWVLPGERKRVPDENPQGRRWNTLALSAPDGAHPAFDWIGSPRAFTAEDLIRFLLERPPCPVPLVVVLDNASLHRSRVVQEALPRLWAQRIYFYFLPPYSPELNDIAPVFRGIKYYALPERTYTPLAALEAAVDGAYTDFELQLVAQPATQLRPAA
jgi:putative transposase